MRSRPPSRLQSLGVPRAIPGLAAAPASIHGAEEGIARHILALRTDLPREWKARFDDRLLLIAPRPLALKVPPPWRPRGPPAAPAQASAAPIAPCSEHRQGTYSALCPAACGNVLVFEAKPMRLGRGWPKIHCTKCGQLRRTGNAVCIVCRMSVASCACSGGGDPGRPSGDRPRSSQTSLAQFFPVRAV